MFIFKHPGHKRVNELLNLSTIMAFAITQLSKFHAYTYIWSGEPKKKNNMVNNELG